MDVLLGTQTGLPIASPLCSNFLYEQFPSSPFTPVVFVLFIPNPQSFLFDLFIEGCNKSNKLARAAKLSCELSGSVDVRISVSDLSDLVYFRL